jgi:hypothetical protein
MDKQVEVKVYAVGVDTKGRAVIRMLVNGGKFYAPTDARTMARLAELGVKVVNGD